jgi:hypothetical protein
MVSPPQCPLCQQPINNAMKIHTIVNERWPGRNRNRIYDLLVTATGSGPFDGGCVVFAQALQMRYGGDIEVLLRAKTGQADHAVVRQGNIMIDADGAAGIESFIQRFERNEQVQISGHRPIEPGDLQDAARDPELSKQIAKLL